MEEMYRQNTDLIVTGYFYKTFINRCVENFFIFLILVRLFVLSERVFFILLRFLIVYFLIFNNYYFLVLLVGLIGVLSRVTFHMTDWTKEEMKYIYKEMYNEGSRDEGYMFTNREFIVDDIIIAPKWRNAEIMYYMSIMGIVIYFKQVYQDEDYPKRFVRLPITREKILEQWTTWINLSIESRKCRFYVPCYPLDEAIEYNKIISRDEFYSIDRDCYTAKSVSTVPYRNVFFYGFIYIGILY